MNFLKIAAVLTMTSLLCGCVTVVDEPPSWTDSNIPVSGDYVTDEELYDRMVEEFAKGNFCIDFDGIVEMEVLSKVCKRIKHNYPEYYWMDYSQTIGTSSGKSTVSLDGTDIITAEEILGKLGETEAVANKIIYSMPEGLDDFEKVLFVHDYIAENTVYATDKKGIVELGEWDTAYGCLVQGEAVCGGYASAFSYVMKCLGIESGVVSGEVAEENGEMVGHAWNYVCLNGRYYWLDLTWNDTDDENNPVVHTYFLIDDMRMSRNRITDENQFYVPICYSMVDNYYVRYNSYITVYSTNAVGEAMASSPEAGAVEMMFADKSAYESAIKGLFENGELWELAEYGAISESVSYMTNDDMYVLSIQY